MDTMQTLRLKERRPVEDEVENWDDDDDFQIEGDDLALRNLSSSSSIPTHRRDSLASRLSMRSERESVHGEEETQVHVQNDDEKTALNAIAIAASAGIPIPTNVPPSALQGTIKRLGGRKVKKILQEDWADDLMIPDGTTALLIKSQDPSHFPDVIRQVSSSQLSPSKLLSSASGPENTDPVKNPQKTLAPPINLDRFRDTEEDCDLLGDGTDTIKVSKIRQISKPVLPKITTISTPPRRKEGDDDFEKDLELPSSGTLKLSSRREIPRTPLSSMTDEFDWGEGSLGTRYGGTRRDGRSNRSSSASAFSPSIASSITAESEDETQLDGLELPAGPLDLKERLRRQRRNRSPERPIQEEAAPAPAPAYRDADDENIFSGLDVGDGSVFAALGKFKTHTNVKTKDARTTSPSRPRAAVSVTFTSKPVHTASRLPRPASTHHERTHTQSSLEPVSECGGPITSRAARRPQSRLGHMSQSSQSSGASTTNTPVTPSGVSFPPITPRRREVGKQSSSVSLRTEPTTTNAQLLRLKRSLPAMKPISSSGRPMIDRPPSRTDTVGRPQPSTLRPKTPVDRTRQSTGEASSAQTRKPFLPAGSGSQSSNVNARRALRRHDSDISMEMRSVSRAMSLSTARSPSPNKRDRKVERLTRAGVRLPLSLPKRPRHFGDGHELDAFDDLPTSAKTESEYVKQPKMNNQQYPTQFRNKVIQHLLPGRTNTPTPSTPHSTLHSPARLDHLPHFARDTASSRIARETNLAHRVPSAGPLAPLTSQRVAQLSTRSNLHTLHPPHGTIRSKKAPRTNKPPQQLKPHLIANLNSTKESKSESLGDCPRIAVAHCSCRQTLTMLTNLIVFQW